MFNIQINCNLIDYLYVNVNNTNLKRIKAGTITIESKQLTYHKVIN